MRNKSLKKMRRFKQKGQATVEYLVLFIVLALLTILGLSEFYPRVKDLSQDLFIKATQRIVDADLAAY